MPRIGSDEDDLESIETRSGSPAPEVAVAALRHRIAGLRLMTSAIRLHGIACKAGFDPNQPRIPRGHPDGGQWTRTGGSSAAARNDGQVLSDATPDNFWKPGARVAQAGRRGRGGSTIRFGNTLFDATPGQQARFTAIDRLADAAIQRVQALEPQWKPRPSLAPPRDAPGAIRIREGELREAQERLFALEAIARVRTEGGRQLEQFEEPAWLPNQGTVAVANVGGRIFVGGSSQTPLYEPADLTAARNMVRRLVDSYPDVMSTSNLGRKPNDAAFHAESTVLLRAATANGGSLSGLRITIHTDRAMCESCKIVLPRLAWKLGNVRVTIISPGGVTWTAHNGVWIGRR